jgi:dCTP deaminase
MYLSDRDLAHAVMNGDLIVNPPPVEYGTTSIDLHLDTVDQAKVWNVAAFEQQQRDAGAEAILRAGAFTRAFAQQFHRSLPEDPEQQVYRDGKRVILKPHGFFLWLTREEVGTPEEKARLICFVDGKSTSARTGLVVHMTAPTVHAGWWGKITLEICNFGPFTLALHEGDPIAQVVVAQVSSVPEKKRTGKGIKSGQRDVSGSG